MSQDNEIKRIMSLDSVGVIPARFTYDELLEMNLDSLKLVKTSPFYSVFDDYANQPQLDEFKSAYLTLLERLIAAKSTTLAKSLEKLNDSLTTLADFKIQRRGEQYE